MTAPALTPERVRATCMSVDAALDLASAARAVRLLPALVARAAAGQAHARLFAAASGFDTSAVHRTAADLTLAVATATAGNADLIALLVGADAPARAEKVEPACAAIIGALAAARDAYEQMRVAEAELRESATRYGFTYPGTPLPS